MKYKCRVFCERVIGVADGQEYGESRKHSKICVICRSIMDEEGAYCKACIRKICNKDKGRSYSTE